MPKFNLVRDEKILNKGLKKDIKWTPKKLTLAGIGLLVPYTAMLVYMTSFGVPLGFIIVTILFPLIFFGGFYLLYFLTKNI